jgi:[NiFe] hydrogenase diaphorase moiety large subunit
MSDEQQAVIDSIAAEFGNDRGRLLAIVQAVQDRLGCIDDHAIDALARSLRIPRVEVADMASFYSFLNRQPKGQFVIRLSRSPLSLMKGAEDVAQAFEKSLGNRVGQTNANGKYSLSWTSDIGMADQEPSALVNDTPLTRITVADVPRIVAALEQGVTPLPNALVSSSLIRPGPVLFAPMNRGAGVRAALNLLPEQVIAEVI